MAENEQLYYGGTIVTVDCAAPTVSAVAVRDGLIVCTGSHAECRASLGPSPTCVDLGDAVMLPGFIDTHLHPSMMIIFEMCLDLSAVNSLPALQKAMSQHIEADRTTQWLLGLQFDENVVHGVQSPIHCILDEICPDRSLVIVTRDGHSALANSKAIEAAGVSRSTPDPEGGEIERYSDGKPSGVFREAAVSILTQTAPFPPLESIKLSAMRVFDRIAQHGITSVGMILQTGSEGIAGDQGVYDISLMELLLPDIPINLYSLLVTDDIPGVADLQASALNQPAGNRDRTVGGIKFWSDGTFGSCTAFMEQPFSDFTDRRGFLVHKPQQMYQRMVAAHQAGLQIAIHSIGDASSRVCINLFKRLFRELPGLGSRHRLEHASLLNAELVTGMAQLGLVVSTQPLFVHSEKEWLPKRLGPERIKWTYPFRSLLDAGIVVAGASDAPIEALNVLHAIGCCVTREGFEPQQAISVEEAIRMFTLDAAYAQNEESIKGSLSPGKRADMVILNGNPMTVDPEQIRDLQVQKTICGGKTIFQRDK